MHEQVLRFEISVCDAVELAVGYTTTKLLKDFAHDSRDLFGFGKFG